MGISPFSMIADILTLIHRYCHRWMGGCVVSEYNRTWKRWWLQKECIFYNERYDELIAMYRTWKMDENDSTMRCYRFDCVGWMCVDDGHTFHTGWVERFRLSKNY